MILERLIHVYEKLVGKVLTAMNQKEWKVEDYCCKMEKIETKMGGDYGTHQRMSNNLVKTPKMLIRSTVSPAVTGSCATCSSPE